jgi:hypothetical protein
MRQWPSRSPPAARPFIASAPAQPMCAFEGEADITPASNANTLAGNHKTEPGQSF